MTLSYKSQSHRQGSFTLTMPDGLKPSFYSSGFVCNLQVAEDGNTTHVRTVDGSGWFIRALSFDGEVDVQEGEAKPFLSNVGNWSGGSCLRGFVAMKPGSLIRLRCKGERSYLQCTDEGIRSETHDPRAKWEALV